MARKKYHRATCIPPKLIETATKTAVMCEQAWRILRPANNWKEFLPLLEKTFSLSKEIAVRQGQALELTPYNAVIDQFAPGFNQENIDRIFSHLKSTLPILINKIRLKQQPNSILTPSGSFSLEKQKALGLEIMEALGFDFQYGRLDSSPHPFCSGGPNDIRITTRYSKENLIPSLLAICHETGHGLYEQGLPKKWIDQPVGQISSMVMHESQSLLIEMEICRSLPFIEFLSPLIQNLFGYQEAFKPENFYKLITTVKPSLIRVDADEVTYPLHVILRYEIEKCLFNSEISIQDLPVVWDELMTKYLGLSTKDDYTNGVMQDVHWATGAFGYFPAYTLGRLMASQLFVSYRNSNPSYKQDISEGKFKSLQNWLKTNVYSYASLLPTQALLTQITGHELDTQYFIDHIESRYLEKVNKKI